MSQNLTAIREFIDPVVLNFDAYLEEVHEWLQPCCDMSRWKVLKLNSHGQREVVIGFLNCLANECSIPTSQLQFSGNVNNLIEGVYYTMYRLSMLGQHLGLRSVNQISGLRVSNGSVNISQKNEMSRMQKLKEIMDALRAAESERRFLFHIVAKVGVTDSQIAELTEVVQPAVDDMTSGFRFLINFEDEDKSIGIPIDWMNQRVITDYVRRRWGCGFSEECFKDLKALPERITEFKSLVNLLYLLTRRRNG